jgi:DNA phosphorothioation-dependent restriction protein DptH
MRKDNPKTEMPEDRMGTTNPQADWPLEQIKELALKLYVRIILHRFNSPAWLKHIQKANAALLNLTAEQLTRLRPGEAYVWSSKATDPTFSREAVKIQCRLRATQHGGDTKTAV